jgi:hypothetical protein
LYDTLLQVHRPGIALHRASKVAHVASQDRRYFFLPSFSKRLYLFRTYVNACLYMQLESQNPTTHQLANNTKTQRQTTTQLSDGETSGRDLRSVNLRDASQ